MIDATMLMRTAAVCIIVYVCVLQQQLIPPFVRLFFFFLMSAQFSIEWRFIKPSAAAAAQRNWGRVVHTHLKLFSSSSSSLLF